MRKRYVPVRERKTRRANLPVSFSGLGVSVLLFFGFISLISGVQASLIKSPVIVSDQAEVVEYKITDSIVGREDIPRVISTTTQIERVQNVPARVANFPLEKSWPVRGRLTTYYSGSHPAIDIAIYRGTPVHPFASGIVTKASWLGSFGNCIIIQHTGGWETIYAHLDKIFVSVNQEVNLSTTIGAVGSTGLSTGPHLHFQLSQAGRTLNPLSYLP